MQALVFTCLQYNSFENNVEKEKFLLFPVFFTLLENFLPFPPNLKLSSANSFVSDDNFKFDENGRKLSKQVENTVGKGEIARCEQFLLFPQCFQKACFPGASKGVNVWEWIYKRGSIPQEFESPPSNFISAVYFLIANFQFIRKCFHFTKDRILSSCKESIPIQGGPEVA